MAEPLTREQEYDGMTRQQAVARLREVEESRSTIMRDLTARCRELEAERDDQMEHAASHFGISLQEKERADKAEAERDAVVEAFYGVTKKLNARIAELEATLRQIPNVRRQ